VKEQKQHRRSGRCRHMIVDGGEGEQLDGEREGVIVEQRSQRRLGTT